MTIKWRCCICDNIFYFTNDDQRLMFMMTHSNTCSKVLYPDGSTAYVGPANIFNTKLIDLNIPSSNILSNNLTNVETDGENKKPWITLPEKMGYATAKLLLILRDMYNLIPEQEFKSLMYIDNFAIINELDREKAVKIYCNIKSLVDLVNRVVYIDDVLYTILLDDKQIIDTMKHNISAQGITQYYIHTNSRNMYARQIACALRRLDKL